MLILPQTFYNRSPLLVAPELVGKILVRDLAGQLLTGRIVEVEAYLATEDPAAHGARGRTKSNAVLFHSAGSIYIHSMHRQHCLDIVTEGVDVPSSVLIRALEPLNGIEIMQQFRNKTQLRDLTTGPGKLTQALSIDKAFNGLDLTDPTTLLYVVTDDYQPEGIVARPRIGISKATDLNFRFYLQGSEYLSHK